MHKPRWTLAAIIVTLGLVASGPAGAVPMLRGSHDGAIVSFVPHEQLAVYMNFTQWGTTYYDGVPPQEAGGLGDVELCLEVFQSTPDSDMHATGCTNTVDVVLDRMNFLGLSGSFPVQVHANDTSLGARVLAFRLTLEGTGAVFPGERAQLTTAPGVEGELSLQRTATVTGVVTSAPFGGINIAGASAVMLYDECGAVLLGPDPAATCRY